MSRGSKLRAAVIGVGYLGNFHAQKYSHLSKDKNFADKVELVGVCDPKFEQAQKVAKELGTRAYASPKELLKEVDLVTIASTTSTHYEVAKMFLENGVHVNVEKPMTVSAIEAENLVSIAKDKRLKLAVGHVERFNPAWLLVKPDLSQVTYAEFTRHATFKSRGADVSVIEDVMIHDLDLVLHLSQNAILSSIKVSGTKYLTGNWDFVTADLTFGSNFRATVSAARVASEMNRTFRAFDKNSAYWVNLGSGEVIRSSKGENSETIDIKKLQAPKTDALLTQTEVFVNAVLGVSPLIVSGQDGLDAIKLAEMIRNGLPKS